ncbi:MAG: winged helix-turn-helix transcriptional regulator [Pseudolabrys sp.]|jgi:DNA-binding MarR family transcriptional regulator
MADHENTSAEAGRDDILLGVLTAIDRDSNTSQRTISRELDVALGLANAYLKRCVRKGLIKIKQVPRRRYAYYLTPQGFAEKSRLTAQFLSASFTFFRRARDQISALMLNCTTQGMPRIAFAGISDLTEVGTLCAHDHPVTLVGIVDPDRAGEHYCGLPVRASLDELGPVDVVIVTSLTEPLSIFRAMEHELGNGRVLAPQLLSIGPETGHGPPQSRQKMMTRATE